MIKLAISRVWVGKKGNTQSLVKEHADFSLETKAGEPSDEEQKYQHQLDLGLSPSFMIRLLHAFSFLIGKLITPSWQMNDRCEVPSLFLFIILSSCSNYIHIQLSATAEDSTTKFWTVQCSRPLYGQCRDDPPR